MAKPTDRTLETITKFMRQHCYEPLLKRIEQLEKSPLDWRGIYAEGETYPARSIVSHSGSMWFTASETKSRPGEGRDWVLCVKRGRDGRSAKP